VAALWGETPATDPSQSGPTISKTRNGSMTTRIRSPAMKVLLSGLMLELPGTKSMSKPMLMVITSSAANALLLAMLVV
jgi:hypothetical protein